jgi:hypothetical protein
MGRPEIVAPGGAQALVRCARIPQTLGAGGRALTNHPFTKEDGMLNAPTLEQLQALKLAQARRHGDCLDGATAAGRDHRPRL